MVDQEVNQAHQPDFTLKTDPVSASIVPKYKKFYIDVIFSISRMCYIQPKSIRFTEKFLYRIFLKI